MNSTTSETVRLIVASNGSDYALTGNQQIVRLSFKTKAAMGAGSINVSTGLVADGDGEEYAPECFGKTFTIISVNDVNHDGEITLGDLAISARLQNTTNDLWNPYTPDVNLSGNVDTLDLQMLVSAILNQ